MGGTSYSRDSATRSDWGTRAARDATKSVDAIYTARSVDKSNDPKFISVRESRDSDVNPVTVPIFIGVDGTGSMGSLSGVVAKKVGLIFQELIDKAVVPGPQVSVAFYRDVISDYNAQYQWTQFESDPVSLMLQVEKFYAVGSGGGSNDSESNGLVWYSAMTKVVADHIVKRGKKGYLFTIGDEEVPPDLRPRDIETAFGESPQAVPTNVEMIKALQKDWHVFHIMVAQGSHMQNIGGRTSAIATWEKLLGQNALLLEHTDSMLEVIVSTIRILEGESVDVVVASWSGDTALAVQTATRNLVSGKATSSDAVVRL